MLLFVLLYQSKEMEIIYSWSENQTNNTIVFLMRYIVAVLRRPQIIYYVKCWKNTIIQTSKTSKNDANKNNTNFLNIPKEFLSK